MQAHARLANVHTPELHTHDRFGRRIDQVEFHPSYHALMTAAVGAALHGTPWAERAGRGHPVQRAAGFMLFTELEPSILCPISMTYAVTPALRSNAALPAEWGPGLTSRAYDPDLKPWRDKAGLTMGMGMTEKQGGSDVRANTTRAVPDGSDAGASATASPATSGSSPRRCATLSSCSRRRRRACAACSCRAAAGRTAPLTRSASSA